MNKFRAFVVFIIVIFILISIAVNLLYFYFPIKYEQQVMKYSKEYELSPNFVFAMIKAESNFDSKARSNKDAIGLMQIKNSTGEWLAKRLNIKDYSPDKLYDPNMNIRLGCWYIKSLIEQYNNIDTALAAYNGGSGNVNKWLDNETYSEDGITIKNIPFQETRKYVEKIKFNQYIYEILY